MRTQSSPLRTDLYHRVATLVIELPPLRERADDIPLLVEHFLRECGHDRPVAELISPAAMKTLMTHHWPGNVRELRNLIERMTILTPGDRITVASIPLEVRQAPSSRPTTGLQGVRDTAERDRIRQALDQTDWNVAGAARLLGTERTSLHKRLRALGLRRK